MSTFSSSQPPECKGPPDVTGVRMWDWFLPFCLYEMKIRRNRAGRPKPPNGWLSATPEAMMFDILHHVGKLTKAAFDGNWTEVIRQCANCANEFAMLAQIAQGILDGPLEPMLGGDRAQAGEVAERKPGGWERVVEPSPVVPIPPSTIQSWLLT
jgi:hypothetical protein